MTEDLLAIARTALRAYDIEVEGCSFAAEAFNTVFRVDAADGASYALRIGSALRIHEDGCEELETSWVTELHGAGLPVPRPVVARDGSMVVTAGERRCVLFDWVPGRSLREDATPEYVHAAGAVLAGLHVHGGGRRAEAPQGALSGDRVLSFRVPPRLGELVPRFGTQLAEAVDRAQDALDALWRELPHPPRLMHGDVNRSNLLADDGRVSLIDFQDLFWGFEIQDVTIPTLALPFADAFRVGYETVRPWPEADAETVAALRAARQLNVLNFGLSVRKPGLDDFIARHAGPVVEWMRTG